MYWEKKWRVPIIAESMTRDRYFKLRTSLKIVFDEDISTEERAKDRLWKVRPFLERVRKGCLKQPPTTDVAVDEMIVPFEGQCGLKTYTRNKPNPWGLKVYVLANPDGIVCDFLVYQGSTTYPDELKNFLKGTAAVLSLTESLHPGHIIYHDRYFTSPELADKLYERDFRSTGTVQLNRLPKFKDISFVPDKELKQQGRGSADTLVREDGKLCVTKWMDTKSVHMLSNHTAINPFELCDRWCKRTKKMIKVPRPAVIKKYNMNMGGIDLANRLNSVCPMRARTKKWTIRVVMHFMDLAVSNAWLQYRAQQRKNKVQKKDILQLRSFKLLLGEKLITNGSNTPQNSDTDEDPTFPSPSKKRKSDIIPLPPISERKKNASHMPEILKLKTFKKCRLPGCKKLCRTRCITCNLFFCLNSDRNCFTQFHR